MTPRDKLVKAGADRLRETSGAAASDVTIRISGSLAYRILTDSVSQRDKARLLDILGPAIMRCSHFAHHDGEKIPKDCNERICGAYGVVECRMAELYALKTWGRDCQLLAPVGTYAEMADKDDVRTFWFDSREARNSARESMGRLHIVAQPSDPPLSMTHGVAYLTFEFDGKRYDVKDDSGVGFECGLLEYMWTEGNYSCDDNRSLFIRRQCDPTFPEFDCGDRIKLIAERYVQEPINVEAYRKMNSAGSTKPEENEAAGGGPK